ncbi:uncharacterized protein LOC143275664 isoform X2 [Babylonia areolata]
MGDRLPVNCGITTKSDRFILTYKVGKDLEKKDITWNWVLVDGSYIAKLEARTKRGDIKFHNSAPMDADTYSKLREPSTTVDGEAFKVTLKKKGDVQDLATFFDVPQ